MAVLYTNNAASILSASITNTAASFSVASGQGALFPAISGGDYFYVTLLDSAGNIEIVKVTARSADTLTITRAQDGTSARAWSAGDKVELRITKAMLDDFKTDTRSGYLPLSGGTLSSTVDGILTLNKSSGTAWNYINFSVAGTRRFYFGLNASYEPELGVDNGATFRVNGAMTVGGNQVLHAGNYTDYAAAAGHTHSYLPLSGGTLTASLSINGSLSIGSSGTYGAGSIYSDSNWGMLFRAKQASPVAAQYRWADSDDVELLRINNDKNLISQGHNVLTAGNYTSYAAPASHSHSYLPLNGGTLTGKVYAGSSDGDSIEVRNDTASAASSGYITFKNKNSSGVYRPAARISGANVDNAFDGDFLIETYSGGVAYKGLRVDENSDVWFYDTSGNAKFQWDAVNSRALINSNVVLHAGNYGSYALPLSGGTLTGQTIFNSGAVFFNDGSSRAMYLKGSGNIIQFCDADGTFRWENVGRNGTYYIYKGYGTGSGYKFQIDDSGNITINNGSGSTNVSGTLNVSADNVALALTGAQGRISFRDADLQWTGYVGFSGNTGQLSFPGRNVEINSAWNGQITFNTGASGYNSGTVAIPYGNLTIQGNTALHAGNYTSYSPSLTGSGASGTWGINVSGNAATASNTSNAWQLGTDIGSKDSALQYWQAHSNTTLNPNSDWHYALRMSHGDAETYYSATIAIAFGDDVLSFRRKVNGTNQTWRTVLHSGNYTNYTGQYVLKSGDTMTGTLQLNSLSNSVIAQHDGTGAYWRGRIISRNSDANRAVFLGNYNSKAGLFAHVNALDDWAPLYLNTLGDNGGSTVYLPHNATYTLDSGNNAYAVLNAGNYTGFSGYLRAGGGNDGMDFNTLAYNTMYYAYISDSPNRPGNRGYSYGTILTFDPGQGTGGRAQFYVSHAGNDLIFRGGWGGNGSWQTWNRVLTDQNYTSYGDGRYVQKTGDTMTGHLAMTGGASVRVFFDGSSSVTSQLYFANNNNSRAWNWQLDENNNAALWGYNGSGWTKKLTATQDGYLLAGGKYLADGWVHSDRDFVDGTLIQTDIPYYVTNGDPFILEIRGNSYGNQIPFDIQYQGYIYYDTIINHGGYSNGTNITGLVAINYNNNLCFWFPRQSYWQGFYVRAYSAYATYPRQRVFSISNSSKPTTAKEVDLSSNIRQSLHSGNYTNYAFPLSGGVNLSGSFGLNDYRLYLRTNGDTNHYLWNADDDWEELVAYAGTGFRIKGSTGNNFATFSDTVLTLYGRGNNATFYTNNGTYGSWRIAGSRNGWGGLEFDSSNGNVSLMIGQDSNTTGFHNNNYGWQFRWASGELHVYKNSYGGGTDATVLDSSNYTSYAPSLGGSGASGTWGISITGNAASAYGLTYAQLFNNAGNNHSTRTDFNNVPDFGVHYVQGNGNGPGTCNQYYGFTLGLGNEYAYSQYAMQFAIPRLPTGGWSQPYLTFRFREGGSWGSWYKAAAGYADTAGSVSGGLTTSNYSSYALPLSGGTVSGVITSSISNGTVMNMAGQSDSFGYNATAGLGTYIKGTGSTYIYGGGKFWDGSYVQTLLHSGNYSNYLPAAALPLTGGTMTGGFAISNSNGYIRLVDSENGVNPRYDKTGIQLNKDGNSIYVSTSVTYHPALTTWCPTGSQVMVFRQWSSNTEFGYISINSSGVVQYNTTSDYRLKTDVIAVSGSGERLDALKPVEYTWAANGHRARGFLAHEFQQVYESSVTGEKDAVDAEGRPKYQAMQAGSAEVIADLVSEVQSLRTRMAEQESIIQELLAWKASLA